jgi:hypothetical protein
VLRWGAGPGMSFFRKCTEELTFTKMPTGCGNLWAFAELAFVEPISRRILSAKLQLSPFVRVLQLVVIDGRLRYRAHLFCHQFERKPLSQQMIEEALRLGTIFRSAPQSHALLNGPIN